MMNEAEASEQVTLEMEQIAIEKARIRAKAATWNVDIAMFLFAILALLIVLLSAGIGIEVLAPVAVLGLTMGWFMGWRRGRQLYQSFSNEELVKLERELLEQEQKKAERMMDELTEGKRVEDNLTKAAKEWRTTFDSISDLISVHDKDFKITRVNKAFAKFLNMQPKEALGKYCYELLHGRKEPMPDCPHVKAIQTKKPVTVEFFETYLGLYLEVTTSPILDKTGEIDGVVHVVRDITEHKQAEEEIQLLKEKYEDLYNNAPIMYLSLDTNGIVIECNNTILHRLGYVKSEFIGKHMSKFVTEESATRFTHDFPNLLKTGKLLGQERQLVTKSGERVDTILTVTMEYDEHRKPLKMRATFMDITERKQMEESEKQLQQELTISSRLATVGEMAAGIAHEINNPLTGVIGFSDLLMKKDIPEDIRNDVNTIYDGAQRIAGITGRMLSYTRQYKLERTSVNVNDIIETTLDMRAYEMESSNIKVTTQFASDMPLTFADAAQLQQVFLNIVLNAEVEMINAHGKGSLSVKTERIDNTIRLSFKDDGPGIPKKNMERIFDPFFTTREVGQGAGLGLSVSHGIVTQHGGKIYAQSIFGKGATFFVELPIVTKEEQLKMAEPVAEVSKTLSRARVLVVDDDTIVQEFLKELLREEGHEVEIVENGNDALDRLGNEDYDVILLDIKLPGMSGIELYRYMQKTAKSLARRVVFITGDVMSQDTMGFLSKTRAPYITKPFDAEQLKKDIDRIISQQS